MPRTTHTITVPLDLSRVAHDLTTTDTVKVVAQATDGRIVSTTINAAEARITAEKPTASAKLTFDTDPGTVKVALGPDSATDAEILSADTIGRTIPGRFFDGRTIDLTPIQIGPWYWERWRRWCRTITVTGRVVCADGLPVPGATVTAYDIDWWFLWTSKQYAASATTGPDGTFTMEFRWCCGLFPWWWWFQNRPWVFDPHLAERIGKVLDPGVLEVDRGPVARLAAPTTQPSLAVVAPLLAKADLGTVTGDVLTRPLAELEPKILDRARELLVKDLPVAPDLQRLGIWPWAPWAPWRDCSPDLVFSVTQSCGNGPVVVLDEGVDQTRWDVPDRLDVTLVAGENACCVAPPTGEDCLVVDTVCGAELGHVAGNDGAPATPAAVEGYLVTGTDGVDQALDIPFGGVVTVTHNPSDLVGLDYYGFEYSTDAGATWQPLPQGSLQSFARSWKDFDPSHPQHDGDVAFAPVAVAGYGVYETRRHFEDNHFGDWAPTGQRYWLSPNWSTLLVLNSATLPDGHYRFRVVEFTASGPDSFTGPTPARGCDDRQPAFALTLDNRVITAIGHDPGHNCGGVHVCTVEPDTAIVAVRIDGQPVEPCDMVARGDGTVEIEILAHDPDGHLGSFTLTSHWGVSNSRDLTALGTVSCTSGGPDATSYSQALAGGATRPTWTGGTFVVKLPVTVAFPDRCCYLLRLEAVKRTLDSCYQTMRNVSEMTLGVGV